MNDHEDCPECGTHRTERVNLDTWNYSIEATMVCEECPTQWTVSYGNPHVTDVVNMGDSRDA